MLAIVIRIVYNVISGTGKVSLHYYKKKKGTGDTMENIVYLLVVFLLGAIWIYTYTQMIIVLERTSETYGEEYTIYKEMEESLFFVSSIEYGEVYGTYHIRYCHRPEDKFIRLPKYEALALVMALNCYLENEEDIFKLKKL